MDVTDAPQRNTGYTKEEVLEFLSRKVWVAFSSSSDDARRSIEGHVEEVALSLYAEGRLEHLPVYFLCGHVLLVEYFYAKDVRRLRAFPPDLGTFEAEATPGSLDELAEQVESLHPQGEQTIMPVPIQRHPAE